MKAGDEVIVLADPLEWGVGTIKRVTKSGLLVIGFRDGTVEAFRPTEVELVRVWAPPAEKVA